MLIERYGALDAVFMTVITITSVGFGEVHRLDAAGQVFTIVLIGFGVIGFLYTFGVMVELLSGGRWQEYRRFRRMEAQLSSLRDHVVVCGYGRTGAQVVLELQQLRTPYVVVEVNPEPLESVRRDGELHVVGDAASDDVLQLAGIAHARALVSAVDNDERNVYIVLTARSLHPDLFIVARSSYPDSLEKLRRAGANRVVSPYTLSGSRMAALAAQPAAVDALDLVLTADGGAMRIEELMVPADVEAELTAATLRRSGAVVLAVRSPDGRISVGPQDSERLRSDQVVIAMGTREQLTALGNHLQPVARVR